MTENRFRKRPDELDSSTKISVQSMDKNMNGGSDGTLTAAFKSKKLKSDSTFHWWYEDRASVILLSFLYVLQGIPLGLAGSIPMLLAVSFSYI